jgi:hypothetical protein
MPGERDVTMEAQMTARFWTAGSIAMTAALAGLLAGITPAAGAAASQARPQPAARISRIQDISSALPKQNAEVEEAADPRTGFVYAEWIGTNGIGFARSVDGGYRFGKPLLLPRSHGGWDPAVAVGPNGTVYAAFMNSTKQHSFPVVAASFNHGQTFPQVSALVPGKRGNWGDRDFIAVAPDGTLYLTWDYGPSAKKVKTICNPQGSCAFSNGDLNVVLQRSTDGGKTWSPIIHVSPGFPASGGDSAPLLVEPSGRIDLEYQGYQIYNRKTYAMKPAHSYFTSSADGGKTWSAPVRVGPRKLTMSLAEWWIDGAIGSDSAGNLYITWDSQTRTKAGRRDVGWLSYSTDHGRTWSPLIRVTPDTGNATHIVQPAGGRPGVAYVGWLADNSPHGYAQYLRVFSIRHGWVTGPIQVSRQFGRRSVWPGDTFGITVLPRARRGAPGPHGAGLRRLSLTWGSAVPPSKDSEIYTAVVTLHGHTS